jgi:hypothetical protein
MRAFEIPTLSILSNLPKGYTKGEGIKGVCNDIANV